MASMATGTCGSASLQDVSDTSGERKSNDATLQHQLKLTEENDGSTFVPPKYPPRHRSAPKEIASQVKTTTQPFFQRLALPMEFVKTTNVPYKTFMTNAKGIHESTITQSIHKQKLGLTKIRKHHFVY